MTCECFALNLFERTDLLKVRAQCESSFLLAYLKVSPVLELSYPEANACKNPAHILGYS